MANSPSTHHGSQSPRRLAELLNEQQEPFVLEVYLLERVSCSSEMSISTWSNSEIDGEINSLSSPAKNEITANYDQSFSDRLMNHNQWRIVEENKQCSPVSVLEEIDLLQAIPVYNVRQTCEETTSQSRIRFQKKVSEDAILSASLWEQLIQLKKEKSKQKQKHRRKPFPDYMNTKRALHHSRQLLFDCVRETIENRKRNNNNNNNDNDNGKGLIMGPQEIGKIICRNLKKWGKLSIDETNIDQVMKMDLMEGCADEWGCFDVCNKEIVREIGNGIVDEIIEEIIKDLNHISIINVGSTSGE
ncbi:unnamed protein product [Amaranthus hypochondriacus]